MSVAEVKLLAAELGDGEQIREVCPFCQGGSTGEKSLNVTVKDGLILYNCHRASCSDGRGAVGDTGGFVRTKSQDKPRTARITPYMGELLPLDEEWREYLRDTIGWTEEHHKIGRAMYAADDHRVAYPIFSPLGARRGWVLRSYEPSARPKALTRMDVEEPHLSWYRQHLNNASCVVVEDIPSAVRAARYTNVVALCGSGCGPEYAMEIARYHKRVAWALDADATATAIKLWREYASLFDQSSVIVLQRDFKDEEEETLCNILSG